MKIYIKDLNDNQFILDDIEKLDFIGKLKFYIQNKENIKINQQRLVFHGKELENCKTLEDYNIKNESTLILVYKFEYFIDRNDKNK